MTEEAAIEDQVDLVVGLRVHPRVRVRARRGLAVVHVRPVVRGVDQPPRGEREAVGVAQASRPHLDIGRSVQLEVLPGHLIIDRGAVQAGDVLDRPVEGGVGHARLDDRAAEGRARQVAQERPLDAGVRVAADADQQITVVVEGDAVDAVVVVRGRQAGDQWDRVVEVRTRQDRDLPRERRLTIEEPATVQEVLSVRHVQLDRIGRIVGIDRDPEQVEVGQAADARVGSDGRGPVVGELDHGDVPVEGTHVQLAVAVPRGRSRVGKVDLLAVQAIELDRDRTIRRVDELERVREAAGGLNRDEHRPDTGRRLELDRLVGPAEEIDQGEVGRAPVDGDLSLGIEAEALNLDQVAAQLRADGGHLVDHRTQALLVVGDGREPGARGLAVDLDVELQGQVIEAADGKAQIHVVRPRAELGRTCQGETVHLDPVVHAASRQELVGGERRDIDRELPAHHHVPGERRATDEPHLLRDQGCEQSLHLVVGGRQIVEQEDRVTSACVVAAQEARHRVG